LTDTSIRFLKDLRRLRKLMGQLLWDNYFDLEAGESRRVIVTNQFIAFIALTPEMVSVGWH